MAGESQAGIQAVHPGRAGFKTAMAEASSQFGETGGLPAAETLNHSWAMDFIGRKNGSGPSKRIKLITY